MVNKFEQLTSNHRLVLQVFSDGSTDQSVVIEIVVRSFDKTYVRRLACAEGTLGLCPQEHYEGEDPARFYLDDLLSANEALESTIESPSRPITSEEMPLVRSGFAAVYISGQMAVKKGRSDTEGVNKVLIQLAVLQIPEKNADILITLNTPIFIHEQSSSAIHAGAGFKNFDEGRPDIFFRILTSFKINDFSLFG